MLFITIHIIYTVSFVDIDFLLLSLNTGINEDGISLNICVGSDVVLGAKLWVILNPVFTNVLAVAWWYNDGWKMTPLSTINVKSEIESTNLKIENHEFRNVFYQNYKVVFQTHKNA